jgi:hypothetical protein
MRRVRVEEISWETDQKKEKCQVRNVRKRQQLSSKSIILLMGILGREKERRMSLSM